MITQLCSRPRVAVFRAGISAVTLLLVLMVRELAVATPVSVRAYGTTCPTQRPMPNAFGRYILDNYGTAVLTKADDGRLGSKFDFVHGESILRADPAKPYEVGALGSTGSALIPGVHVDHYNTTESRLGSPSFPCEYATATDSNPGYFAPRFASNPIQPGGSTLSSWLIGSARQTVDHEHDHGPVHFSYYQTNQALGAIGVARLIPTGVQTGGGPGFSYVIDPYTRFYSTVSLQNQRPALSILMQFKAPLSSHPK